MSFEPYHPIALDVLRSLLAPLGIMVDDYDDGSWGYPPGGLPVVAWGDPAPRHEAESARPAAPGPRP